MSLEQSLFIIHLNIIYEKQNGKENLTHISKGVPQLLYMLHIVLYYKN